MKEAREVIALSLPTFAHCYKGVREVTLPSFQELLEAADRIIAAVKSEGYEIERGPRS
jgi:hypothetical protein